MGGSEGQMEHMQALTHCQKGLTTEELVPLENEDIQGIEAANKSRKDPNNEGNTTATSVVPENKLALKRINTLSRQKQQLTKVTTTGQKQ